MVREAKFNFEEERRLVTASRLKHKTKYTVSINAKHGYVSFSIDYIRDKGLDGKFIKLYADPEKKAFGWKLLKGESMGELNGYRQLKYTVVKDKVTGYESRFCKLSARALLKAIGAKEDKSYIQLPIKSYTSSTIMGDSMDYVQL